jgi:two-component system, chemotaxis family, CheB/CheR fusion protein
VLRDAPFSHLDLVSCRNLLIYLNNRAQTRVLDLFHFSLNSNGLLFLGTSESVDDERPLFKAIDKKQRLYSRNPTRRQGPPVLSEYMGQVGEIGHRLLPRPAESAYARTVLDLHRRELSLGELHFKLLEGFAPGSVLIDKDDIIVHLSERSERYLHLPSGEATLNLLHVVHPMLRLELRTVLFRARQIGLPAEVANVTLEIQGSLYTVDMTAKPALDLAPGFLLVIFEEHAVVSTGEVGAARSAGPIIRHLEQELDQLKIQQRTTVEEYEASLEELKSSNEELQAINEELRSASEEVETSREEAS